ncbi:MAG: LAGLIDADG family homing endonuclease [Candidatus Nanoarchaeia archaeon]|nr:LAGLIDADG family homing endonuclease [Candidatus Nanoarchaeia archaeon]
MDFDISKIKYSSSDVKKGIILPKKFNEDLAEEIGILIGDGHLTTKKEDYGITISGHFIDDQLYHKNIIIPLFQKLYNAKFTSKKRNRDTNELTTSTWSKAIFSFHNKILNLPRGNKVNKIQIPEEVILNKKLLCAFLRGIIDTDGSLVFQKKYKKVYYYPRITIGLCDKHLMLSIKDSLLNLGFTLSYYSRKSESKKIKNKILRGYNLDIYGEDNLKKWCNLIGFNNPKHTSKYQIWKKFGHCPPKLNTFERLEILKQESL